MIESRQRMEWERARMVAYHAVSPYFDSKKATPSIQKFLPFEWDKEKTEKAEKMGKEELINLEKRWKVNK